MSAFHDVILAGASGSQGYQISRSVRLRSSASAYFNRTPASAGNRKTWTWSGWVKRGTLGAVNRIFSADDGSASTDQDYNTLLFNSSDQLQFGGNLTNFRITTAVYRDPSAWYHIVFVTDTTQATAANRFRLYVNGSEVASFGTSNNPTQNTDLAVNAAIGHFVGSIASGSYFDGYLTEINFIDGQALTPSSFGETDTITGVWKPKRYTGTYGTNGFYLPFNISTTPTFAGSFNGSSQYLTVPANAAFNMGSGDFTVEAWVYFNTSGRQLIASQYDSAGSNASGSFELARNASNVLSFLINSGGTAYSAVGTTTLPTGQWIHVAGVRSGNTLSCYMNGVLQGSANVSGVTTNSSTQPLQLSGYGSGTGLFLNGQLSNVRIVKGTAVYTGAFTPSTAPLAAISGTSLLTLQNSTVVDNSSNAFTITNVGPVTTSSVTPFGTSISSDASGNNNHWTSNNVNYSVSGVTYDSMLDVPTPYADGGNGRGNYCTWNPLSARTTTLTNGNLAASTTTGMCAGTIAVSSGKWYWECTPTDTTAQQLFGIIAASNTAFPTYPGQTSDSYGYYAFNGNKYTGGTATAYGAAYGNNDVIGVALDLDAGTLVFYKNGTSQGTAYSGLSGTFMPAAGDGATNAWVANFGQRPFAYTPPTGFKALNTQNLPDSTIKKGNQYFNAVTWTGDGVDGRTITGVGFNPDLVWAKGRSNTGAHVLADAVRGTNANLYTNLTDAETNPTTGASGGGIGSVTTDGFVLEQGSTNMDLVNTSSRTYVAWQWKESATAGFDIVTYTGTGTNGQTIAHSLGVTPSMVIYKCRGTPTSVNGNWLVWHRSISQAIQSSTNIVAGSFTGATYLNLTSASGSYGFDNQIGENGKTYVAYAFAEVAGFSRFGSYTGNGSTDGPFVYCGFRPAFIMAKDASVTNSWVMYDLRRDPYNVSQNYLIPNSSGAEGVSTSLDITANGFKIRTTGPGALNTSGSTVIFAAFAENPFKNSLAR